MIRPSSIALGELIAVANPAITPSEIIIGLNDESHGDGIYTENFRKEIVDVTSNLTNHTPYLEAASDRLAEVIRGAMANISEYGKPLAVAIAKHTESMYSRKHLRDLSTRNIGMQFIFLDDPFFDSPIYPTEVKDKGFTYTNVDLSMVKDLSFDYADETQIMDYIATNHADLVEILRERDYNITRAAEFLTDVESLNRFFHRNENGHYDFTKVRELNSELLLKAYILLTKMYGKEDPVPWLKSGDLSKYREYVSMLWNGMTRYLISLRQIINTYRAQQLVLVVNRAPALVDGQDATDKDTRYLSAEVTVYYTSAAMDAITGVDCSLPDVTVGYLWERVTKSPVPFTDVLKSPQSFAAAANSYFAYVHEKRVVHARDIFINKALEAIQSFVASNEAVNNRVAQVRQGSTEMLSTWLRAKLIGELERCFYMVVESNVNLGEVVAEGENPDTCLEEIIMCSKLVPTFLRTLGCVMAAEILEDTFIERAEEDNVHEMRERLHVSLINLIVARCVA